MNWTFLVQFVAIPLASAFLGSLIAPTISRRAERSKELQDQRVKMASWLHQNKHVWLKGDWYPLRGEYVNPELPDVLHEISVRSVLAKVPDSLRDRYCAALEKAEESKYEYESSFLLDPEHSAELIAAFDDLQEFLLSRKLERRLRR